MTDQFELFKDVFVTIVTQDNTIVVGHVGHDASRVQAAEGPSANRAWDMIGAIGEALGHDSLFADVDALRDSIDEMIPWEGEGFVDIDDIARDLGLKESQHPALQRHLNAMVKQGRLTKTDSDTYFTPLHYTREG